MANSMFTLLPRALPENEQYYLTSRDCLGIGVWHCVCVAGGTRKAAEATGGHSGRNAKARGGGGSGSCSVVLMD